MKILDDQYFMNIAYQEAILAFEEDEVPIGCVLVIDNQIISKAHNQVEKLNDPTAHAEILCITSACESLNTKYLYNSTIYITTEPCKMCFGAIELSRISSIVYGIDEPKFGYFSSLTKSNIPYKKDFLKEKIHGLMNKYFQLKRKKF